MVLFFTLTLLAVTITAATLPPARISFSLNSPERPLVHFSRSDIRNTTTLWLSKDQSTLYVGAKDTILSLDVRQRDVISLKRKVHWGPSEKNIDDCQGKQKSRMFDCPNFVRVLQPINSTHLYACGSFAYNPQDAIIDAESLSISQQKAAMGRCPYNPFERSTALMIDEELFTATTTDFKGQIKRISRHFSKNNHADVSLHSGANILVDPTFIGSSADLAERKVYFFFNENGQEFKFLDEPRITRVAQVCKDDVGGERTLQKKWTSFVKTSLICQIPKKLPFNILQDVFTLYPQEGGRPAETLFYGVFTSQWSSSEDSAVCIFKLSDLRQAFLEGSSDLSSEWTSQGRHLGQCGLETASDSMLENMGKMFFNSQRVMPVGGGPVLVSAQHRYSRVAAMKTQGLNGKEYDLLYLLTGSGILHKVGLFDEGAQIIEEIQVFGDLQQVHNFILSPSKGVLYIGTSDGVTAVPIARCSIYSSCLQCLLSRDPLCGWSHTRQLCSHLNSSDDLIQVLDRGNMREKCPATNGHPPKVIKVRLYDAVTLDCGKPSHLARVTWTSPRFTSLPKKNFIQSDDGSLTFFFSSKTSGIYHCETEEGFFKEVTVSYDVQGDQHLSTSTNYHAKADKDHRPEYKLNTSTIDVEPNLPKQPGPENDAVKKDINTSAANRTNAIKDFTVGNQRSYYTELVVVSLFLAAFICILMLAMLCIWCKKRMGSNLDCLWKDNSKDIGSMESMPSLGSPGDVSPEPKVME